MNTLRLTILGSPCAISDMYYDIVQETAQRLNLDFSIQKTETEEEAACYGVEIACLYGYCPGCAAMSTENPESRLTPALAIDGKLVFHSGFPGEAALKAALSAYVPS